MGIQAKWEYKLNGNTRWDMQEADQKTPKKKKKKKTMRKRCPQTTRKNFYLFLAI